MYKYSTNRAETPIQNVHIYIQLCKNIYLQDLTALKEFELTSVKMYKYSTNRAETPFQNVHIYIQLCKNIYLQDLKSFDALTWNCTYIALQQFKFTSVELYTYSI